jgi:TRAP-type mannitol/chloroaromatic compound transport system substrate-binding protein
MLVVIGRNWLSAADEQGRRRLDLPTDYVRNEIALALKRKIAVFPVLVDGATLPVAGDLPADLQPLAYRQAATIRHETFARDLDGLTRDIQALDGDGRRTRRFVVAASSAALVCAALAVGVMNAPQLRSLVANFMSPATTASGPPRYGTPSSQLADWQRDVQTAEFTVEASNNVGPPTATLIERLRTISRGQINLKIVPAGSIVRPADRLDAVSRGTLDAAWDTPAAWSPRAPAFAIHGGQVPLGLDQRRFAHWLIERAGRDLELTFRDRLGLKVKSIPCRIWPTEGLWLKSPVKHAGDLKGLTLRTTAFFFNRVATELGMRAVDMPASELVAALARGGLDAAEYSHPEGDRGFGLHRAVSNYFHPSFHAPASSAHLMLNLDRWNAMPAANRGLIEEACRREIEEQLRNNEAIVARGLVRLRADGVTVHTVPPDIVRAVERAMQSITDDLARADADFKRTWSGYSAYR